MAIYRFAPRPRRPRYRCREGRFPLAILLVLFSTVSFSRVSAEAPPTIEWKAEMLSVSAERAPLAQILREVARRTGIEIQGLDGLQEPVSVRFADLPLREGLEKLLAERDYAILGDLSLSGGNPPVRVLVSGQRVTPETAVEPPAPEPAVEMEDPGTEIVALEEEPDIEVDVVGDGSRDAEPSSAGLLTAGPSEAPGAVEQIAVVLPGETASVEPAEVPVVIEEPGTEIVVQEQEPVFEVEILGKEGGEAEVSEEPFAREMAPPPDCEASGDSSTSEVGQHR
jgi:hypothetical protein